jgi:AraC family transcriptional regulator of adaptative response/methylated-DNA-[protein]-cysteine methyltransferase
MSLTMNRETKPAIANARWKVVLDRNAKASGAFVYAVKTTGIYCRPSCPSRAPKRGNVVFFDTADEAEAQGFRACLRCRPAGRSIAENTTDAVAKACRMLEDAEAAPKLSELAAAVGMSPFHFHRQFKAVTGLTPKAYGAAKRAKRVRAELADDKSSVTNAIYGAGFNSSSRFYEKSAEVLGMTPMAFKKGGKDEEIRFALGECSLGAILVARSEKGVCAISFGDDPDALIRELEGRFPNARLIGGDRDYEQWVARVVAFVEAPQIGLDLPLDIRGSAFEERVWRALREIPSGETASYSDIAGRIGEPGTARAVAQACAANKLAVAIPCHRVVRSDGGLSGYRWGVERKRRLLGREKRA